MAAGVENVLKRMGLVHAAWASEIADAWPSIAGTQLAKHSRPGTLQGAELTVYVDSSVWLNELQRYGLAALLRNVQEYAGEGKVRRVRLQLDPDGGR
jgi:predicted nucleic acid-binding Zn ribbon protein